MGFAPSGSRVLHAQEKWTALRTMHEEYGVPLDVLQPLAICAPEYFAQRTQAEEWQFGSSSRTMLARMSAVAERQLTQFQNRIDEPCEEKRARALALMAKTLETIAVIEKRLGADNNNNNNGRAGAGDADDDKRAVATALEAELAALVEAHT